MNKLNKLTVLFIVTIIMVLLMLLTIQKPDDSSDDYVLLFPELSSELGDIDRVHFSSTEGDFDLVREGDNWYIPERWNYQADYNLVKRALFDIAETKILERKTADPEKYYILGVSESDVEDAESVKIGLFSNEDEDPKANLILGNIRETGGGVGPSQRYVRRVDQDKSWLVQGYLNINPVMLNWIKSEIINIDRNRIREVNIIQPNGQTATVINMGAKDKFGVPNMTEGTAFKYKQLGYDIAGTLNELQMEDVQPVADFSRGNVDVVTAEFITYDGLKVLTQTSFIDGVYFTTFSAVHDENLRVDAPEDIQKLEVLKTAEQVEQEVAEINAQLQPWVYKLAGFIGTNLMRAEADLVTRSDRVIPMPADVTGGFGR